MIAAVEAGPASWIAFVLALGLVLATVPGVTWLLRAVLPRRESPRPALPPIRYGTSSLVRRSPRQAVRAHRTVLATSLVGILTLLLWPLVAATARRPVTRLADVLEGALLLVVPSAIVVAQSRVRDRQRERAR